MRSIICCILLGVMLLASSCQETGTAVSSTQTAASTSETAVTPTIDANAKTPRIASWLAKKDEIIVSGKPYDLVMAGWFTPEEAAALRQSNPGCEILAGLSLNWVWDNPDWMSFLITVAGYGREEPFIMREDMYLHHPDGGRCDFGWASEEWGHEEIFAMDPRSPDWVELITSFYRVVLEQPQHDGIIVDMVLEVSWCPDAITNEEWLCATRDIMDKIKGLNVENKPVLFNAGRDYSDIDAYHDYFDGFLMENFLGEQMKTSFEDGLRTAEHGHRVVYAVDTDDTGEIDMQKMRLGLVLSLLVDNAWFTYDVGHRDHGQAWWFPEYDVCLGQPLCAYYREDGAYYREYQNGAVVASPDTITTIEFEAEYIDVSTGRPATTFTVGPGDARIYLKTE